MTLIHSPSLNIPEYVKNILSFASRTAGRTMSRVYSQTSSTGGVRFPHHTCVSWTSVWLVMSRIRQIKHRPSDAPRAPLQMLIWGESIKLLKIKLFWSFIGMKFRGKHPHLLGLLMAHWPDYSLIFKDACKAVQSSTMCLYFPSLCETLMKSWLITETVKTKWD